MNCKENGSWVRELQKKTGVGLENCKENGSWVRELERKRELD